MFTGDEGLADGLLPEAQHAAMSPHLVYEGLKHHPFLHVALLVLLLLLCIRGLLCLSLHSRTHPPLALTTLSWALASSHTHTQCGGGPIWQGHAHTCRSTEDWSWYLTFRLQGFVCFFCPSYSHDVFRSCCCDDDLLRLCCWRFCWSKNKGQEGGNRRETEKKSQDLLDI